MKFAVVHPTLTAARTEETESRAQDVLDALQASTQLPGHIRIVPDPVAPTAAIHQPWEKKRSRGRRSLLARASR